MNGLHGIGAPPGRLQVRLNFAQVKSTQRLYGEPSGPFASPTPVSPSNGSAASDLHLPSGRFSNRRLSMNTAESRIPSPASKIVKWNEWPPGLDGIRATSFGVAPS